MTQSLKNCDKGIVHSPVESVHGPEWREYLLIGQKQTLSPPSLRPVYCQVRSDDEELDGHRVFTMTSARGISPCTVRRRCRWLGRLRFLVGKQGRALGVLWTRWCCVHRGLLVPHAHVARSVCAALSTTVSTALEHPSMYPTFACPPSRCMVARNCSSLFHRSTHLKVFRSCTCVDVEPGFCFKIVLLERRLLFDLLVVVSTKASAWGKERLLGKADVRLVPVLSRCRRCTAQVS